MNTLDASEPKPFRYYYRGLSLGDRKGQCCELIHGHSSQSPMIRFADGFTAHVPRYTVRRLKEARNAPDHCDPARSLPSGAAG